MYCRARTGVGGAGPEGQESPRPRGSAQPDRERSPRRRESGGRPDPGCARPGTIKQPPLPGRAVQRGRLEEQQPPAPAPGPARTCCRRRLLPPAQRK